MAFRPRFLSHERSQVRPPGSWFRKRIRAEAPPPGTQPDVECSDAEHVDRIALLLLAAGDVRIPAERMRISLQLATMLPAAALGIIDEAMLRALELRRLLDLGSVQPHPNDWTTY